MNFAIEDSPEQSAFRVEVRAFLDKAVRSHWLTGFCHMPLRGLYELTRVVAHLKDALRDVHCPVCLVQGRGDRVVDPEKSVLDGGLIPWSRSPEGSWYLKIVTAAMKAKRWNPKTPIGELPAAHPGHLAVRDQDVDRWRFAILEEAKRLLEEVISEQADVEEHRVHVVAGRRCRIGSGGTGPRGARRGRAK